MPFVDLSKPINPVAPLPPLPIGPIPVIQNNSVLPGLAPVATSPVLKNVNDDDQGLMRDVPIPANPNINTQISQQGIKEFSGPPVNAVPTPVIPPTNNPPPLKPVAAYVPNTIPGVSTIQPNLKNNKVPNLQATVANAPLTNSITTPQTLNQLPQINSVDPIPAKPIVNQLKVDDFVLSGTAKGKEAEVNQIFQQPVVAQIPPGLASAVKPLKPTTADQKFLASTAGIVEFLNVAEQRDASDIHLSVGYPPLLRVNGTLITLGGEPMSDQRVNDLFYSILTEQQKQTLEKDLDIDFSYTHTSGTRFRINIYHKKGSLGGAFRLIPSKIRTIAELNLPKIIYDMLDIPQGLIILAGPTGSGKSTSIASMIQEINMNEAEHIITIEDPVEYIFPLGKALVNQREVGNDVTSFKRGLREVLREDPDVILVGEMRDFETIAMTITAAETGHLVFTTLHTNSASQTVDRMIDVFPETQQSQVRAQLANVLSAVISQRLIPVKSGGRKAVVEIMIATPAIRNAIREAKTYQIDNMIQTNADLGMITLEKSLLELIRKGEITMEQAQTYTSKPDELITLMKIN
ncbi:MAG: type IV pilus twitching motility protein PilT [bacterium]